MSVTQAQQQYSAVALYYRAIGCARIGGAEFNVVNFILELGWFRPRFVYGSRKASPVVVRASQFAAKTGYDRHSISRATGNLRDGGIILDRDGGFVLNPDWRAWIDNATGELAIKPTCYHYVEFGADESQGLHDCDVVTDGAPAPQDTDDNSSRMVHSRPNQLSDDGAPAPQDSLAPNRNGRASEEKDSSSDRSLPNEKRIAENTCIYKPTDAGEITTNIYTHTDGDSQSIHAPEPTNATAVCYTMNGELPGPFDVDADKWSTFTKLTDQFFPMQEMASTLFLHRRQFPTSYFVKIAKRCIISRRPGKSYTPAYMLSVMRAWGKNPDGPDRGPEDEYADDMHMIVTPTIPFEQRMPEPGATGDDLEPSRIDPANKAWLLAAMKERMRKHVL